MAEQRRHDQLPVTREVVTSDVTQAPSPTNIKATLLEGTATIAEIAQALGCSERTVYRMNLPYVIVAGKRRAPLALARERIMAGVRNCDPPPPRPRGRPRTVRPAKAVGTTPTRK